jgi:hypothetical protein
MSVLLLDVWHDLRAKRLAPVAIALLVALAAVPVFLLRPADDLATPPVVQPGAGAATTSGIGGKSLVTLAVLADPSTLDVFDSKDPFKPLKKIGSDSGGLGASGSSGDSASKGGGGGAAAGADGVGSSQTGGNSTTGSDTQTGGTTGGTTTTTAYTYNVDVKFGERGDEKELKGLDRLEMLPDENDPKLVFLGVDSDVKNVVFLVDSSLTQSGEGTCKPDEDTCSFVYLSLDDKQDEHSFTDQDGKEYTLKLLKINRVEVDPDTGKPKGGSSRKNSAGGALSGGGLPGFGFPLFTDLVASP